MEVRIEKAGLFTLYADPAIVSLAVPAGVSG
jgi:hypothetical protein